MRHLRHSCATYGGAGGAIRNGYVQPAFLPRHFSAAVAPPKKCLSIGYPIRASRIRGVVSMACRACCVRVACVVAVCNRGVWIATDYRV